MRVHNLPPYVYPDRDRHGTVRYYFKRRGSPKIRIRDKPGTEAFRQACAFAMVGGLPTPPKRETAVGSLEWLCTLYFNSAEFKGWETATQTTKRDVLKQVWREPLDAEAPDDARFGEMPADMPPKALRTLRDRWAATPAHANNMLAIMTALYGWAIEHEHAATNPARDVKRLKFESEGYHTWTADEMAAYEARHATGTQARLAFDLLALIGCRRSDVVLLGPAHIITTTNGERRILYKAKKNKFSLDLPMPPELEDSIAATATGVETFLLNALGRPWKISSFSDRFKEWCKEANLPHCSAHGVRKAGAVLAAEGGSTDAEMMAYFGWTSPKQAARYRKKASNAKMADKAGPLLRRRKMGDTK
mgnify:CR=1 FL=1